MTHELRAVGGAFLVAVLVCDLTFDLPVWRANRGDPIVENSTLGDMTRYYRRITAKGSLFATAVSLVMLGMLASIGYELVSRPKAGPVRFVLESSLAAGPIVLAVLRTFPHARRFATGGGDVTARAELARCIARDHIVALPAMLTYVVMQLAHV